MSEFGLKIRNYQAGSIHEYNLGVRDYYQFTKAMLSNSLFLDFLKENGLEIYKEQFTRDIICIQFDYGSSSYDEAQNKLYNKIKEAAFNEDIEKLEKLNNIKNNKKLLEDKYQKNNKEELRTLFYRNGVDIEYVSKNNRGNIINKEVIHYKFLFRTPGKAKKGERMFIREELYEKALDFIRMGIKIPEIDAPLVEMEAYSSLITSSIIDRIEINPKDILILKDYNSPFVTNVISIETNENKECIAKHLENYTLKNTLFDGQALIEASICPTWTNGYLLLRHHFCKMASFKTNIQIFFKDYFKDKYDNAIVFDMFGNKHFAKDIKLITTNNAMKWIKFDVSYDHWCKRVNQNGNLFGIVKTAHSSKFGEYQRMSYQMVNALDMDSMDQVVKISKDYIERLKEDDNEFLKFLEKNDNYSNDYNVLVALCKQDHEFIRSQYFRDRKSTIIKSYVREFKNGRLLQNADNLVIVGSPYAMLLHSVGEDVNQDDTFEKEEETIQCYTKRFDFDEYLAEFRSPFNSRNNLGYLHNIYNDKFDRYFDFDKNIIAVNLIGTDFEDRNNGSDMDSDSVYTTNQKQIVEHAKYCYKNYPTIVNNIQKDTNHYNDIPEDYAKIDNKLASSSMAIGISSNLAQLSQVYAYNFNSDLYNDYTSILAVLAQIAIDNAKRSYDIDLNKEIDRIKKEIDVSFNGYPDFWKILNRKGKFNKLKKTSDYGDKKEIRINESVSNCVDSETLVFLQKDAIKIENRIKKINKNKTKRKNNDNSKSLICPMNYLYNIEFKRFKYEEETLPMSHFFVQYELEDSRRKSKKVEELIEKYSIFLLNHKKNDDEDALLVQNELENLINEIKTIYISDSYIGLMSWLINRTFCITSGVKRNADKINSRTDKNKPNLLNVLYRINPDALLKCFSKNVKN